MGKNCKNGFFDFGNEYGCGDDHFLCSNCFNWIDTDKKHVKCHICNAVIDTDKNYGFLSFESSLKLSNVYQKQFNPKQKNNFNITIFRYFIGEFETQENKQYSEYFNIDIMDCFLHSINNYNYNYMTIKEIKKITKEYIKTDIEYIKSRLGFDFNYNEKTRKLKNKLSQFIFDLFNNAKCDLIQSNLQTDCILEQFNLNTLKSKYEE